MAHAAGLDALIRGLGFLHDDATLLTITDQLFDALYEHTRRDVILGYPPS